MIDIMMENNQKNGGQGLTACFTGHRNIAYEDALRLPALLDRVLVELIERGATAFRAGGAIGFDTVAALKATSSV